MLKSFVAIFTYKQSISDHFYCDTDVDVEKRGPIKIHNPQSQHQQKYPCTKMYHIVPLTPFIAIKDIKKLNRGGNIATDMAGQGK